MKKSMLTKLKQHRESLIKELKAVDELLSLNEDTPSPPEVTNAPIQGKYALEMEKQLKLIENGFPLGWLKARGYQKEGRGRLEYFYNEKGDYTLTLDEEPILAFNNRRDADKLIMVCEAVLAKLGSKEESGKLKLASVIGALVVWEGNVLEFKRSEVYNSFEIKLTMGGASDHVVLPFDHITDHKLVKYVKLIQSKLEKVENKHEWDEDKLIPIPEVNQSPTSTGRFQSGDEASKPQELKPSICAICRLTFLAHSFISGYCPNPLGGFQTTTFKEIE